MNKILLKAFILGLLVAPLQASFADSASNPTGFARKHLPPTSSGAGEAQDKPAQKPPAKEKKTPDKSKNKAGGILDKPDLSGTPAKKPPKQPASTASKASAKTPESAEPAKVNPTATQNAAPQPPAPAAQEVPRTERSYPPDVISIEDDSPRDKSAKQKGAWGSFSDFFKNLLGIQTK